MNQTLRQWVDAQAWREVTVLPEHPAPAAAAYLAVMAYPESREKRDQFMAVVGAYYAKRARDATHTRPSAARATLPPRDIARALGRAQKRIETRLLAAEAATALTLNRRPPSGIGTKTAATSVRRAAALAYTRRRGLDRIPRADDQEHAARMTAERRNWAASKPVMHLAAAYKIAAHTSVEAALCAPGWVDDAVRSAINRAWYNVAIARIAEPRELILLLPANS